MSHPVLLSTAYFAPVSYYSKTVLYQKVYIEKFENFIKQTYRNRCEIMGANGPVSLVVPVKGRNTKTLIKDICISYDTPWQKTFWRTIFSAYNSSPFFEYYKDDIRPFFEREWKFLFEMNLAIHDQICNMLETENNISFTENFEAVPHDTINLREAFSPKKHKTLPDKNFQPYKYTQVFSEKSEFIPDLSILDLIFNEGPNSFNILRSSIIYPAKNPG
ncbi:MAG: WbqC family protein [Prolixibacteraceae bacterium]|nr:WbqC family protein [Prolixibacteraceae bacterium]